MTKSHYHRGACAAAALTALAATTPAVAADITFSGFVRQEVAVSLSDDGNPFNTQSSKYNGVTVPLNPLLDGLPTSATRSVRTTDNDFNLFATRLELNSTATLTPEVSAQVKLRAYYDWNLYDDNGDTSFFAVPIRGGDRGSLLEVSGREYMVDLPVAFVDYASGPLLIRAGNQQIAWGESLFFRVLDLPNGLDLRRHLILDPAAEEYADKRVPALGVRVSYQVTEEWEIDTFVQQFNPSITANPSTPYNAIPDQFTVHDRYDWVDGSWNVGGRLRGQLGDLGLQFVALSRRNPDGIYRWTKSGVTTDLPGMAGSGAVLAQTPFEVDPATGVVSAREWFDYASMVRLNGTTALNSAVDDFQPFTSLIGAFNVGDDHALAGRELDTFFALPGGLRGHIERYYPYENVFGFGANYIFTDEPDTLFDQLIARVEMSYTPDKKFTDPSLSQEPLESDEWTLALVFEKYYRFSPDYPATYMVLQYLHKSDSDLFGRSLEGYGGSIERDATGVDGYNALALAVQQPSPSLEWRFDLSVLYDLRGGAMFQPGVKWKPDGDWQVDLYATLFATDDDNRNALSTVDYADEAFLRVTRQF
ncbi:DUF1302 family protein [Oleomonas cavernae]|uniref:DUF1302 family protein n=1 Tax=Oleomonas cavernae TaxID=2320859 RepID=A0A418WHC6_9PROT|nr:DUF1302 family protein [Oleomonas cavernae]RJF89410.1 DUF1302 family protein [Oleomonas cavernae]